MTGEREDLPWELFGSAADELATRVAANGFAPLILAVARGEAAVGVDGQLRGTQRSAACHGRRHRVGGRGDLRLTNAVRFGRFAIARIPRLAGCAVVAGPARRHGVRGVHVDHPARRSGDDTFHALPLRGDHADGDIGRRLDQIEVDVEAAVCAAVHQLVWRLRDGPGRSSHAGCRSRGRLGWPD